MEPVSIISQFIETQALPVEILPLKAAALSSAWISTAQLHIRARCFRQGVQALLNAFTLCPQNFLSPRTLKILANSLFNRPLHRLVRLKNRLAS